jgi:hypothetical protein
MRLPWHKPQQLPAALPTSEFRLTSADVRIDAEGTAHIQVADLTITDSNFDSRDWTPDRVALCIHVRGVAPCEQSADAEPCFMRIPGPVRWWTA